MNKRIEIPIGSKFGMLTVAANAGGSYWECICDCGKKVIVKGGSLNKGNKRSCGCLHSKQLAERNVANAKHGGKSNGKAERLYRIWGGMKKRCETKSNEAYTYYGGRGIKVCDDWQDYKVFKEWAINNGYKDNLSIDRIDTNGNYEPKNCRWATAKQQANNRRNNRFVEYRGEKRTIYELSKMTGLSYQTIHSRLFQKHWDIEKAINTPVTRE